MADYDRRGGGSSYNSRKRRYRDDDEYERRAPPRRRYDNVPPPHVRVRKQLIAIAENPMRPWHEEVYSIATLFTDNWDDELLRSNFVDLALQLAVEQPLKTPFVAAVVIVANAARPEIVDMLLAKLAKLVEEKIAEGEWRQVKLYLKLLACLQGCLEGEGIFPLLEELFNRAVDLQTASSEDTIGTEIVKIILLTLPYVMVAAPGKWNQKAADLMEKTEVIASEPHTSQALVEPWHPESSDETAPQSQSLIGLLQAQLQNEANNGWALPYLPRPWEFPPSNSEMQTKLQNAQKHALPAIQIPETVIAGPRPLFPEVYFSVYANQEVQSVPPTTNAAASLIRDALLDTINQLDFNRNVTARHLIDLDCFFSQRTFTARATPFDKLREIEPPKSTWKPEDVAVDAVFSQIFTLPNPEHKLVYYHSVLTEACKLAPAAIAPSLGRAIRYLYRNAPRMDWELAYRFMDWFAHHLSNFGFTWKWTEWVDDVELPDVHPRKAFILGAIDKEIRLSFAQRIKNTLPDPYKVLIPPEKEKDAPDFKFANDETPFAPEGREIASLLKRKAADEEIETYIQRIQSQAVDRDMDALVASTDVFVTCVLHIGNKSLSHVLAAIERTKDRLADAGAASDAARAQIITATMAYWSAHPGVAITIIEKLLNYSILTPAAVLEWVLRGRVAETRGRVLGTAYMYELVANTVNKVTSRVRGLAFKVPTTPEEEEEDAKTRETEVARMRALFTEIEEALAPWASSSAREEQMEEDGKNEEDERMVRRWADRWLRVFRRRAAIEETWLVEAAKERERKKAKAAEEKAAEEAKKEQEEKEDGKKPANGVAENGEGEGMNVDA